MKKFNIKNYITRLLFIMWIVVFILFNGMPVDLFADEAQSFRYVSLQQDVNNRKDILILNSDATLLKYSNARDSFISAMGADFMELDLGSKWFDLKNVEKTIKSDEADTIYCIGTEALRLAQQFARKQSIVFSSAINWQRFDLSKNTYGISNELNPAMQLLMYKYIFPEVKNLGVIYSKTFTKEWVKAAEETGETHGLNIVAKSIKDSKYLEGHLEKLLPKVDALWLIPDPVVLSGKESIDKIFKLSEEAGKPVFAYSELFIDQGASIAISPDIPTIGRQAAEIAKSLSVGEEVTKKVLEPAGSNIILNLKQVEKLKIYLNMDALDSVNKITK